MSLLTAQAKMRRAEHLALGIGRRATRAHLLTKRRTCTYATYVEDPAGFVRDVLGESVTVEDVLAGGAPAANAPWERQREIMEAVRDHRRVVVRASHSVGKTHIAARVGIWFLYTRAPAIVITTAPNYSQVRDLLWARWRSAWAQAAKPLSGQCLLTRCDPAIGDSEWYAVGQTARDAESFSGYHEAHLLLILDEAPGVPAFVWAAAEGLLSSENARILAIGNPIRRSGAYYQAHRDPTWHRMHISCLDHPNVQHQRLIYPSAVAPGWPEERRQSWGDKHPLYLSRVLGEFPDEGEDNLIPLSWIEAAVGREVEDEGTKTLGVDVARFGVDETVMVLVTGRRATILDSVVGRDTVHTAGRIIRWAPLVQWLAIDDAGVGGGVVDMVRQDRAAAPKVVAFNAGGQPRSPDDFEDAGSEAMWLLREACREAFEDPSGKGGISLPDDEELVAQLASRRYEVTHRGRIRIEPKEQLRRRGEHSPDRADALAMAWWATWKRPKRISLERVYV